MTEIVLERLQRLPIGEQRVEIVERKGLGHPDSICDLELLVAEIMGNQTAALGAFKRLGFEKEAVFYNYVKDQTGQERNLIVMMKNLQIERGMVPF